MTTKNDINVAKAGVLGAVIGAAVGAGAVALSNDKNQEAIKNKFEALKKQGQKVLNDLQSEAKEQMASGKEKVEVKVASVKKDIKSKL